MVHKQEHEFYRVHKEVVSFLAAFEETNLKLIFKIAKTILMNIMWTVEETNPKMILTTLTSILSTCFGCFADSSFRAT